MALRTVSNIPGIKAAACSTNSSGIIGGEAQDSNLGVPILIYDGLALLSHLSRTQIKATQEAP